MYLLLDNYDSFTFILNDYLLQAGFNTVVYRNDSISISEISALNLKGIILGPGGKTPNEAGIMMQLIEQYQNKIPILGVCLGHQAIGAHFGAKVQHAIKPVHGKTNTIQHTENKLFVGIPKHFEVMRYHSLIINQLPECLETIAITSENEIMAIAHKELPMYGVQFHPESILTQFGLQIIQNFKNICNEFWEI